MNSHWADREFHAAQILMGDEMQLTKLFQEMNKLSAGMEVNWTAIWLLMLLVYIYIAFFIMDLYTLVKKKTPEETFLIMLLPGSVIATATIMFILFLNIRADARLESAWTKAVSPGFGRSCCAWQPCMPFSRAWHGSFGEKSRGSGCGLPNGSFLTALISSW